MSRAAMEDPLKYALPLSFVASPAFAHVGAHPEDAAPAVMILALAIIMLGVIAEYLLHR